MLETRLFPVCLLTKIEEKVSKLESKIRKKKIAIQEST